MTIKLTRLDLNYILTQIEMAEAGQFPINPLLPFGLRQVAGTNNNLAAGQSTFGSADVAFPTLTTPLFQKAQATTDYAQTSGLVIDSSPRTISLLIASQNANNPLTMTAAQKTTAAGADGILGTADDVFVNGSAAAFAAQQRALGFLGDGYQNYTLPGADGIYGTADDTGTTFAGPDGILGTADDITTFGNLATPMKASDSSKSLPGLPQSLFIPNVTPDNGLSAPYNSFFTFFGQFFDHGLDKITTNSVNGTIFIPLNPDDPLYNPASPGTNFMIETRAQDSAGPDGILGTADDVHQFINQDTPFVDQSQTYGSDPSHQAFLRAYMIGADGKLHSTGALLGHIGIDGLDSMATWAELKANAAFLGLKITDYDVGNVPVLNVDAYGNLILGPHGFAEFKVTFSDHTTGFVEGNHAGPGGTSTIGTSGSVLVAGKTLTYAAVLTGNAFINDMAQGASPFAASTGAQLPVDPAGQTVGINPLTGDNTSYDPTLLAQHYVAGDGRVNENIGLTAIQNLFHSEHDRLLATIEATAQASLNAGDIAFASNWVLPGVVLTVGHQIAANEWNGERLFQAAKFGTETEYQHIVFDEFARAVAPAIHVFSGVNVNINPAISSEFANVVYRFGHSMLDENLNLYVLGADGKPVMGANGQPQMTTEGLIQAFTNPVQFANTANATADIVLGTVNQVGNEIDEFVTGTLQDNLLGLPLDLASLNIARGRDTGVPPLNLARAELFAQSGEVQLKPYTSWEDFGSQLKHIESLVNFVAAYGTHASLTIAGETNAAKQAAAAALVSGATLGSLTFNLDAYNFMNSLGAYANNKLAPLAIHDANGVPATWSTGSVTGLDDVDMWIGGLAEKQSLFGGVLGSTFEYVFRTQMEALQDGDRLYYLARIEGTDYEDSLQDSSLAQLIRANTNIKHLPGNIFTTPEYTIEATDYFVHTTDAAGNVTFTLDAAGNRIATASATWLHNPVTGALLVNVLADGTVQFLGDNNITGNQIVLGGTEGNDRLVAGASDADTVWGDGGNDYLDGGGGADFLFGGLGNDTLNGGQGADTLHGDEGNDTIYGGDGIDTIFGGDGNDYIEGGRGDDIIDGGLGNDIIIGNEGADTLVGDQGDDWLESQGGQGDLMFGDSGAPGGQLPLYSGNDVMVGGVAGGDVMKGFSGDDIMLGHGSFTKFEGGAGFDWGSYELATQGVDEDMNRKEFVAANGAVDNIRDVWQSTEGASGSAFDDVILGDNATKLLVTKDELDNVNLITGLAGFFDPGLVSFDGGNILLGGAGNDLITGGGGNDIIDGDAWLHVSLAPPVGSAPGTSGYSAGGQIIRQIVFDPKGNIATPGSRVANPNAGNVDTAGYFDTMSNYATSLDASGKLRFGNGPDAEGFITIQHTGVAVIVGGNPAGLLGVDDGTDRIRHIERLQFSDVTVSIDSNGRILTSSDGAFKDPNDPNYDAVPVGSPILTEKDPNGLNVDPSVTVSVGDILTASVALITDADNVVAGGNAPNPTGTLAGVTYQWQYQDPILAQWVNIAGGTTPTLAVTEFLDGTLGLRLKASYVDGKG
jgi:hypothetical protein